MATQHELIITGARQNNLKNISLQIPHDQVTVITGVSGSGKSSLAFDTIFAEGQWRYIESLSTYARMFLEKLDRPDVDRLEHIRPAIAIEQKNPSAPRAPRSGRPLRSPICSGSCSRKSAAGLPRLRHRSARLPSRRCGRDPAPRARPVSRHRAVSRRRQSRPGSSRTYPGSGAERLLQAPGS